MTEIEANSKSLEDLLMHKKYKIDSYQREYDWKTKHVTELIYDLIGKFEKNFDVNDDLEKVSKYSQYFLGNIIINNIDDGLYIVDGQQRLTTITLLLIVCDNIQYNYHKYDDTFSVIDIKYLIFSEKYQKKIYNINIEERINCMNVLTDVTIEEKKIESVKNSSNENLVFQYLVLYDIVCKK